MRIFSFCFVLLSSQCVPVSQQYAVRRSAGDFECTESIVTCSEISYNTYRCSGCGYSATYICSGMNRHLCRFENGTTAATPPRSSRPRAAARSPRPRATTQTRLSREEIRAVFESIRAEVHQCVEAVDEGSQLTLHLQVNSDGTAIYHRAEPQPTAEQNGCIRQVVNTMRFRRTSGRHFTVSYPFQLGDNAQASASDSSWGPPPPHPRQSDEQSSPSQPTVEQASTEQ